MKPFSHAAQRASRKLMREAAMVCQLTADWLARKDDTDAPNDHSIKAEDLAFSSFCHVQRDDRSIACDYAEAEAAAMLYNDELPPGWEHA